MSNNFKENYDYGTKKYSHLLEAFYQGFAYKGRYVFVKESRFSNLVQQKFKTDTVMQQTDDKSIGIEEKIVQWPAADVPHTRFCLETRSCTNPGYESLGWMKTSEADYLFYGFETKNYESQIIGLDAYIIDFPRLQEWFYTYAFSNPKYRFHTMPGENRTESKLVDIVDVVRNVWTRRHFIFLNGASQRLEMHVDARSLVMPTMIHKEEVNALTLSLVENLLPKMKRQVRKGQYGDLFNLIPVQQQALWEEVKS